jgi:hypothetical protein
VKRLAANVSPTAISNAGFAIGAPVVNFNSNDAFQVFKVANTTQNGSYFEYSWTAEREL